MGDSHMGLQARLMSQALRKLTGTVSKSRTCLIFINQIREKIGVMFGNPETTTGGRALKFYASVRIDIRRIAAIKEGDLIDLAANNGIVEKSGAWYSYKGERIGQGRENARQFLKDNKDTMAKLEAEVRKQLGLTPPAAQAAAASAQSPAQVSRVTTMPSAPTETASKVPAARR